MRVGAPLREVSLLGPVRGRDNPGFARLNVGPWARARVLIDEALAILAKNNKANDRVLRPVQD